MQVHTVAELERVLQLKLDGCMLGINNRDLGTFKVDLHNNKVIMDSPAGQQVPHFSPRLAASGMYICTESLAHRALCGFVCELCMSAALSCLGVHFTALLFSRDRPIVQGITR